MSPAQRKKAPAARRTAARGKTSRAKTPAKRKSHRGAKARGSGAAAAAGAPACDMTRERLERLLDREAGRADVLAHVPACQACTTTLTVVAAQRDSMRDLAVEPAGTAVEFLLQRGRRAGERQLADLVYELAKACLVVVKDIDRRVHLETRPRAQEAIGRDVRGVARRVNGAATREAAARLPLERPDEATALVAAESCIAILEQVEGRSERQRLARGVLLICTNQAAAAEQVLAPIVETARGSANGLHAMRNLLWAMVRQAKYEELLDLEAVVLREASKDWECAFNLAVAAANSGNSGAFERVTARLRRLHRPGREVSQFRTAVIAFEAPRLAEPLGWTVPRVSRALGEFVAKEAAGAR